ncbi:MAG: DinB family protein [Longimicrobiales bacterium]|nr:DinB family protein [Longimicrobiales bacterium]
MDMKTLLDEFEHEMAGARETLSRVPEGQLDFRPHDRSMTLGELAGHIAIIPSWVGLTVRGDGFDMAAPMDTPPPPERTVDLLAAFDAGMQEARGALNEVSPESLGQTWTLRRGEEVLFALPRGGVLRSMILNHMIHHRGQLTVYLRMVGVPIPALYGPSADEG